MLQTPDGHSRLEVSRFLTPVDEAGPDPAPSNRLGIRHLAFVVSDLRETLERLAALGFETVGTVEDCRGIHLLCYVRAPRASSSSSPSRPATRRACSSEPARRVVTT